ncbi:zinc finger B-box domain-containing protein 1 isoform X2 [Hyperolius riggenbachi]|uniref:zinc finger B-box domain-containing protein 1 isoform X2 n=1 Tax=Hyperolius riggenbachi TaxID=752182 RepID=UPI0035A26202
MSTDFVVLPLGKNGNSVRLKTKNIRNLHMESTQLEMQNQEMEQKLMQLRRSMSREKEERERSNGYHWKSGQMEKQPENQPKENFTKVSAGKLKFKILKNPAPEPEKLKTLSRPTEMPAAERPKLKGKPCGQCESKNALLMCLECGEDYCAACFAKFHQKGALKLHRTMPIQGKSQDGKLDAPRAFKKELNVDDESHGNLEKGKNTGGRTFSSEHVSFEGKGNVISESFISNERKKYIPGTTGSLLEGSFNEEESAKYFKDAVLEWRNQTSSKPQDTSTIHTSKNSTGNSAAVQTVLTGRGKPLQVEFKESGLSYMEKLMLKKHRRTPVNQFPRKRLDNEMHASTDAENELDASSDLTAEEMEAHEHYVALFRAEEHVRNDVIHERALKIVELDKEPEEGLEETRHFLVEAVDFSDTRNLHNCLPEPQHQDQLLLSTRVSSTSPAGPAEKRSTYSVVYKPVKTSQDNINVKASHSEDSKSMKYKSFKDSQSLDAALIENVPQEFQNVVLRGKKQASAYRGLKGFFTLETDHAEGDVDSQPPNTAQHTQFEVDRDIISTGDDDFWRPESSLSNFADNIVVQDIVAKAQAEHRSHMIDQNATPRYFYQTVNGSHSARTLSARSLQRIATPPSSSRPSTARARPVSRTASEISEIESIDSADGGDPLFEDENKRETLTVLEQELNAFKSGNLKDQQTFSSGFQLSSRSRKYQNSEDNASLMRSPMHVLERCVGESESDDEETLQDRLNVMSLQ